VKQGEGFIFMREGEGFSLISRGVGGYNALSMFCSPNNPGRKIEANYLNLP